MTSGRKMPLLLVPWASSVLPAPPFSSVVGMYKRRKDGCIIFFGMMKEPPAKRWHLVRLVMHFSGDIDVEKNSTDKMLAVLVHFSALAMMGPDTDNAVYLLVTAYCLFSQREAMIRAPEYARQCVMWLQLLLCQYIII